VLDRALQVLGCFDGDDSSLTLTELAASTRLPLSSTHRIASALVASGFLERGDDRRYRVGTTLWRIAQRSPLSERLRESALPALARLYEETGENITLAVLDRGQTLYVERLLGERSIPTVSRVGAYLPLHTTGVGKVLLAYRPEQEIESYLSNPLARPTRDSIAQPDPLRRELVEVRARGYSVTRQEMTEGSGSIAVPVIQHGHCVAAVGVIVHLARLDVGRLVATLTRAAATIVAELDRLD
jgi:DNA-binding IclR family transcriptional regulator